MKPENRKILLDVVRRTVFAAVSGEKIPKPASEEPELNTHCGCFVTLKNNDDLRGCIGQFVSNRPLISLVSDMAVAASTGDSRFFNNPITSAEVKNLTIEISVLSPLQKTAAPLSLRLGTDGVYIKKGLASGCLLPQVATETGWSREQFLSYCCQYKAGISADAWQDSDTEVYLFTAEIISGDNF